MTSSIYGGLPSSAAAQELAMIILSTPLANTSHSVSLTCPITRNCISTINAVPVDFFSDFRHLFPADFYRRRVVLQPFYYLTLGLFYFIFTKIDVFLVERSQTSSFDVSLYVSYISTE